jgi:hypothetical protein
MLLLLLLPFARTLHSPNCSRRCTSDLSAWRRATAAVIPRNWTAPKKGCRGKCRDDHFVCPDLARIGVDCANLPAHTRGRLLPGMLRALGYRGESAEIGVWKADFSMQLMESWKGGGRHWLVDPYLRSPCPLGSPPDKQCQVRQQTFDEVFRNASSRVMMRHPRRAHFIRNYSLVAAAALPSLGASLDFAYIDARHDLAGVREDLLAWWPKLCPGGLFSGHDLLFGGVQKAVVEFVKAHSAEIELFSITAEGSTPSWFFFKRPVLGCR